MTKSSLTRTISPTRQRAQAAAVADFKENNSVQPLAVSFTIKTHIYPTSAPGNEPNRSIANTSNL